MEEIARNREIKIVIATNPVTKKNSSRIVGLGKKCPVCKKAARQIIIPSEQYKKYEKEAGLYLRTLNYHVDYPVNIKCLYYMKTKRAVDLTNLLEATDDVLVKYGILADDNSSIVAGHDGSRVLHDKDFPRTEIYITPMEE